MTNGNAPHTGDVKHTAKDTKYSTSTGDTAKHERAAGEKGAQQQGRAK